VSRSCSGSRKVAQAGPDATMPRPIQLVTGTPARQSPLRAGDSAKMCPGITYAVGRFPASLANFWDVVARRCSMPLLQLWPYRPTHCCVVRIRRNSAAGWSRRSDPAPRAMARTPRFLRQGMAYLSRCRKGRNGPKAGSDRSEIRQHGGTNAFQSLEGCPPRHAAFSLDNP